MRVEGSIVPVGDASEVNREAWCQLVDRRPEFRRPRPVQSINPFNRQPMILQPTPDVASVVMDGATVGEVSWSMDEDTPLVNLTVERFALPLVFEWAAELGGQFRECRSLRGR